MFAFEEREKKTEIWKNFQSKDSDQQQQQQEKQI